MVQVKRLAMSHNVDTFILVATNKYYKIQLSSHVAICYRYKVKLGKNKNYVTINTILPLMWSMGKQQHISHTPGDHIFFPRKNLYGNTSCVSNVFFLKKNEKFFSRKNIIKMKHFIHIFILQKIVYFIGKKMFEKYYIFPCQFFWMSMHSVTKKN